MLRPYVSRRYWRAHDNSVTDDSYQKATPRDMLLVIPERHREGICLGNGYIRSCLRHTVLELVAC